MWALTIKSQGLDVNGTPYGTSYFSIQVWNNKKTEK